jgi:hypothetical protein
VRRGGFRVPQGHRRGRGARAARIDRQVEDHLAAGWTLAGWTPRCGPCCAPAPTSSCSAPTCRPASPSPNMSTLPMPSSRARSRGSSTACSMRWRASNVRRAPLHRFRHGRAEDPRRRRGHRLGHRQRPHRLRLRQGLHRVRRLAVGGPCQQDHEGPGHGADQPGADHRAVRCRGRAHPGRRGGARRLWRGVPAQRAGVGRHPADLGDHGPVRRRRRLFAGHDRLHLHGEGHELHVRDRPRRGAHGDQRGGHL